MLRIVKFCVLFLAAVTLFGVFIFWPAGTVDWVAGWLHLGVVTVGYLVNTVYVIKFNPELIDARMRMGRGIKRWDEILMAFFSLAFIAIYVTAGFDAVRYGWSSMSPTLWLLGLAIFVPGVVLLTWSMVSNPFFEKMVRIQTERGHGVIDSGPYRFVRHPGYLGFFGWILSIPLFLGSWWAFLPALASVCLIGIRTALEDRTLRLELDGYEAYAARVRYRLLPGVW